MEEQTIPNIIIGEKEADEAVDWRNIETDDTEDTDEELEETPEDVIEGLGFDPKEIEELTEDADFKESEHPRGQPSNAGQFVKKGSGATKTGNINNRKLNTKEEFVREQMKKNNISQDNLNQLCSAFKDFNKVDLQTSYEDWKKKDIFRIDIHASREEGDAECSFTINTRYQEGEIDLIEIPKELQGKNIGERLMPDIIKTMKKSGMKRCCLHADLSVGGYAWARMGFDFEDKADLKKAKLTIQKLLLKKNISLKGKDLERFNNLKTAKDIAEFTIKNAVFTKGEWGIHKSSIPKEMKMHIGKAVLLGYVNDYIAVKEL